MLRINGHWYHNKQVFNTLQEALISAFGSLPHKAYFWPVRKLTVTHELSEYPAISYSPSRYQRKEFGDIDGKGEHNIALNIAFKR